MSTSLENESPPFRKVKLGVKIFYWLVYNGVKKMLIDKKIRLKLNLSLFYIKKTFTLRIKVYLTKKQCVKICIIKKTSVIWYRDCENLLFFTEILIALHFFSIMKKKSKWLLNDKASQKVRCFFLFFSWNFFYVVC